MDFKDLVLQFFFLVGSVAHHLSFLPHLHK
nr:MAG TPA: hypothetical protein [Caudoviricetes sp.]